MSEIIQGVGGAFGRGLATGLGTAVVYIVIIFMAVVLISILGGFIFGLLAWRLYRRKRKIPFLIFGILAVLAVSVVVAIIIGSKLGGAPAILICWLIFSISGIAFITIKYRKL